MSASFSCNITIINKHFNMFLNSRLIYTNGIEIPSFLKLYSVTLNDSSVFQRLNVYG